MSTVKGLLNQIATEAAEAVALKENLCSEPKDDLHKTLAALRDAFAPVFEKLNDAPSEQSGTGWDGRIYGHCPVQGRGCVDGFVWYFRSRGEEWRLEVSEGGAEEICFCIEEDYGPWPTAGWVSNSEAWSFINKGIEAFRLSMSKAKESKS